ncbi:Complement C1r subcomponent, partial [Nibea albiflora]
FMHNNSRFVYLSTSECWRLPDAEPVIHGEVHSPQYPQPYHPNLQKHWHLWVPEGYQIQLSLTHLDIKASAGCYEDSLTVLDDQKVLKKFCGQANSTDHPGKEPVLSPSNRLTLIFQTSDSAEVQQHTGFSATYKAIDVDECSKPDPGHGSGPLCTQICINTPGSYRCSCHHGYKIHLDQYTCLLSCDDCIFDKHKGKLFSPGYPGPSPPLLSCKYIISVEPRFTVTLNFTDKFHIKSVDTEQGHQCLHHWLQVTMPDREPMKLCGGKSPGLIATNTSTVRLDYHTDDKGLSHGWSLEYTTNVIDCGEPEPLLNGGMTFQNQHRSVVQYHCNEPFYTFPGGANVTLTCEADGKWRSKNSDVIPTCIPVCGKPTKQIFTYQRIFGGKEAPDDTIPWQVLLSVDGKRGGGMVIADRWILTAAHVLKHSENITSSEAIRAYMGLTNVKALQLSPVYAASVHVHPEYNNPNGLDYNHDIGLVKLQEPITFNSSIMPICLPAEDATYVTGMMGMVSGFGLTNEGRRRFMTKKLKYVQLPVVEQEACSNSVTLMKRTRTHVPNPTNNMFCAGVPEDVDECSKPDPGHGSGPLCSQICVNTPGSYRCSCHNGYKLHLDQYTCLLSCGDCILNKHKGKLSSPGYPGPSPPFLSCKYIISVEPRFTVTLNFTDKFHIRSVDTEQGPRCLHHWLQVTMPDREPMKLCGRKSPGLIVTNSSTVRLDYHTDDEGLSRGWTLEYTTNEIKCPLLGNVSKGRVTPVLNEYFFRDHIYVTCDQGYRLMMDGHEISTFSAMCQSDGQWQLPLPKCQIIDCGEPKSLLNGGMNFMSGFQNQYHSVVQYHCDEPFYTLPRHVDVCGKPTKLISAYQKIIGSSPDNTIPWHVLLDINGRKQGGMVIADRWIMTAAHVLTHNGNIISSEAVRAYMGHTDVNTLKLSPVYAASVHVHSEYNNPNGLDYNHDIALIKLQEPITFNSSIMPICLPAEGATYTTDMIGLVSGFAITETDNQQIFTNKLKYMHLLVVEQQTCRRTVNKLKKERNNVPSLTNNMFCAGVPEGGKDSCHGDSGSPIVLKDDGRFWAAGIVSWGVNCRQQGMYGVYTRVANYLDWINKTIQEN